VLKVTVPFDFVVDGKILPAATYVVQKSLANDSTGLAIMGDHHGVLTRASEIDSTVTGTKLVFRRIGHEYFLSDVVTLNGKLHFPASRDETRAVQSLTSVAAD